MKTRRDLLWPDLILFLLLQQQKSNTLIPAPNKPRWPRYMSAHHFLWIRVFILVKFSPSPVTFSRIYTYLEAFLASPCQTCIQRRRTREEVCVGKNIPLQIGFQTLLQFSHLGRISPGNFFGEPYQTKETWFLFRPWPSLALEFLSHLFMSLHFSVCICKVIILFVLKYFLNSKRQLEI